MYSGLEEAIYRNISACKEFAQTIGSAYGLNGMNKMVINHIAKQFVTSDAGKIMLELDVEPSCQTNGYFKSNARY